MPADKKGAEMPKETIAVIQETRQTSKEPHSWRPGFTIHWGNPGVVVVSMSTYPEGETGPEKIMSRTLDREAINNAIRVLRRARDSAYGKDE